MLLYRSDTCFYIVFNEFIFVFFFKQKTAYEMRISDWSSDVCSSDLNGGGDRGPRNPWTVPPGVPRGRSARPTVLDEFLKRARGGGGGRSEEHTSELQSLMRLSYAVFCFQKKKQEDKDIV